MIYAALILLSALVAHLGRFVLARPPGRRPTITLPPEQPTGIIPGWALIDPSRVTRFTSR